MNNDNIRLNYTVL